MRHLCNTNSHSQLSACKWTINELFDPFYASFPVKAEIKNYKSAAERIKICNSCPSRLWRKRTEVREVEEVKLFAKNRWFHLFSRQGPCEWESSQARIFF